MRECHRGKARVATRAGGGVRLGECWAVPECAVAAVRVQTAVPGLVWFTSFHLQSRSPQPRSKVKLKRETSKALSSKALSSHEANVASRLTITASYWYCTNHNANYSGVS